MLTFRLFSLSRSSALSHSGRALSSSSSFSSAAKTLDISGIYPPIVTPFDEKGSISFEKLKSNFEVWNSIPFQGYTVLGSNGEAVSLKSHEKVELVKKVRALSNPSHKIIAGTGCHSTAETIELTLQVADSASAALVITPSFYSGRMTDSALQAHYTAIADASPIPIILYSVPANTHLDLNVDVIVKLAKHKNIIGLKDSGGDIGKISRVVYETQGENFVTLAGSAGFLLPSLLLGCVGGIAALANVLGAEVCQLYSLYQKKEWDAAVALQRRLLLPNLLVTRKLGVSGLKAIMDIKGLYGGPTRGPLGPLASSEVEQLKAAFKKEKFL